MSVEQESPSTQSILVSRLAYWAPHAWILAYCGVILAAVATQFTGEYPCPLCMLQRYGMFLSTMGALYIVVQARRRELTPSRFAQALGMGIIGAVVGMSVSVRQIMLHILPGDPGYGGEVLGLHLYTWAAITFVFVIVYCGLALLSAPVALPIAPPEKTWSARISTVIIWIFLIVIVINVVDIILLEGFAWVLPDDPDSYNLIDQL